MSRYLSLLCLLALVLVAAGAMELALRWTNASISLTDTRGVGQVLLFVISIPFLVVFAKLHGGGPAAYLRPYAANIPRALAGFATMWTKAVVLVILAYAVLGWLGFVHWSRDAIAALSFLLAAKTLVALTVVVILAVTEELIFRGFVMRHLRYAKTRGATLTALIASSAIFSLSHLISYKDAWSVQAIGALLVGLFLLGGLFAVTYAATGSLACSIGVHSGLLGFKVFLRRTEILLYEPNVWWLGSSTDLRSAPISWLLMIIIGALTWSTRKELRRRFYIEPAAAVARQYTLKPTIAPESRRSTAPACLE